MQPLFHNRSDFGVPFSRNATLAEVLARISLTVGRYGLYDKASPGIPTKIFRK